MGRGSIVLLMVCLVVTAYAVERFPETPGNAAIQHASAIQVGDVERVESLLCSDVLEVAERIPGCALGKIRTSDTRLRKLIRSPSHARGIWIEPWYQGRSGAHCFSVFRNVSQRLADQGRTVSRHDGLPDLCTLQCDYRLPWQVSTTRTRQELGPI